MQIAAVKVLGFAVLATLTVAAASAAEPPAEPILRIDPGEHTSRIRRIAADAAGRWLVTASDDKTARIWDRAAGKLVMTLRPPIGPGFEGNLFAAAISPDGELVAVSGWTQFNNGATSKAVDGSSIYLFERASGRLLRRMVKLPDAVFDLAFSTDGRHLAAGLGSDGVHVFSVADGKLVASDPDCDDDSYGVQFGSDGRIATTCFDGYVRLYRFDGATLTLLAKRSTSGGRRPISVSFSPDGRRLAVGFFDRPAVEVLDGRDLQLLYAPDPSGLRQNLSQVAWSSDGAWLYAAGKEERNGEHFIRRWNADGPGTPVDWPVAARDTIISLEPLPDGSLAYASLQPAWGILDKTGKAVAFHGPPLADFRENWGGLLLSPEGSHVGFSYERAGKAPVVFDTLRRALLPPGNGELHAPLQSLPGVEVAEWMNTFTPRLNSTGLRLRQHERSRSVALWPGAHGVLLGTEWNLRAYRGDGQPDWERAAPDAAWAVNVSQDGRWAVAAYGDGTIRWHRASDGAEKLALYPHPDRKRWIVWTPEGYFDASPGAEELVGWHLNRGKDQAAEFYPIGWLWDAFYRPDIIRAVLGGQDIGPLIGDLTAQNVLRSPPPREIELRLADDAPGQRQVTASYTVIAADGGIGEVRVFHNGKLVKSDGEYLDGGEKAPIASVSADAAGAKRSFALAQRTVARVIRRAGPDKGPRRGDRFSDSVLIEPVPGELNEVAVMAFNRDNTMRGLAGTATFASTLPREAPRLFVLAVGVNRFTDPAIAPLVNAVKDARDFARAYSDRAGTLLARERIAEPVVLADGQATRASILAAALKIGARAKPQDQFVWFIASHGVMDGNGLFGVIPYDWGCEVDSAGACQRMQNFLSSNDILDASRAVPALKQTLVLDTCHSGGMDHQVAGLYDARMSVLARNMGLHLIAGAASTESAVDGVPGTNGWFTGNLLGGLSDRADDSNADGRISIIELGEYARKATAEQASKAGIAQTPFMRNFGTDVDVYRIR